MMNLEPTPAAPTLAQDITAGQKTFIATVLAVYVALFIFLHRELTPADWLILLALGGAYAFVSIYGATRYARTGSHQILLPTFLLAIILAGVIVYRTAGFFLAGLILLPLASLSVQTLPRRQTWGVDALIILTLAIAYGLQGGLEAVLMVGIGYLAALFFVVYITQIAVQERAARAEVEQLAAKLEAANRKLREYAARAEELAVTRERARLAHEIHDSVGHTLTALDVQMELLARLPAGQTEQRRQAAEQAQALVKGGLADMRRAVAALHPAALETFSLPVAIDGLITQFAHTSGIHTDWAIEGDEVDLHVRLALPLYRMVQEALTNIQRHAATTPQVTVRLCYEPDTILVTVANARPQSAPQQPETEKIGGHGLAGLRERADVLGGHFHAGPDENGNFRVAMRLPISA